MKSETIQRNFHYLLVTGFESHGLIWRCADESLRILAADRSVEEVKVVHRVVTRGGCAIGIALRLRIGWSHSVCNTDRGFCGCGLVPPKGLPRRRINGEACL